MQASEPLSYREEFYPGGFRKTLAIALVVSVTALPTVFSWVGTPVDQDAAMNMPSGRFRPSGGLLPERETSSDSVFDRIWSTIKRAAVVFMTTIAFVLYYPRLGFKRYALLCGPLLAFIVPACIDMYLQGRVEVYRVEVALVMLAAMSPGVGLYMWLTWRKARRQGMVW